MDDIKQKTENLSKPLYEMTSAMYQQQAQEGQGGCGAGGCGAGAGSDQKDNVVDADFEVKDENK